MPTAYWAINKSNVECISHRYNFQVIQSTGSLQKFLAFAAKSTVPDVQQHAVSILDTPNTFS
jgi:hypothetical protein